MLFCSFFCHNNKSHDDDDVTKPSAFLYPSDLPAEATEEILSMTMIQEQQKEDPDLLYPHLANMHQPLRHCAADKDSEDEDISISVESLFLDSSHPNPDKMELELEPEDIHLGLPPQPVVVAPTTSTVTKWTEEHIDQVIHALRRADAEAAEAEASDLVVAADEEPATPTVSKEDFIAVLNRIEKENAWLEKRQAKKTKAMSKKKNKRGSKNSSNKDKTKTKMGGGGLQQRSTNQNTTVVAPVRVPLRVSSQN